MAMSILADFFARFAANTLLIDQDRRRITYGDFWKQAETQARRLMEMGVAPGDRVLISMENSASYLKLYIACALAGAAACPLDPSFPPSRFAELKGYIAPKLIVTKENAAEVEKAPVQNIALPPADDERDFLVIYSSGTTGPAKGIVHSLRSIAQSAGSFAGLSGLSEKSVVYHHFPMFYMAGFFNMFLAPVSAGATIVMGNRFSGAGMLRFWEPLREHGVNHLTLTPTMASSLAHLYRQDDELLDHLSRYEAVISTSSLLLPSIAEKFLATFGVPLRDCYGVTEVGASITLQPWDEAMALGRSFGVWNKEVQIDCDGTEEEPSEIFIKTPFMMKYYLIEGKQVNPFDDKGRFPTGDLGYYNERGELFGAGRRNDAVKKGGEFVSLPLVENIAAACAGVAEASVVAVPDEQWGNRIILFYVPATGATGEQIESAMAASFVSNLRKVEQPDKIIPVPWFPRTAIGKTVKRDLIRLYTI